MKLRLFIMASGLALAAAHHLPAQTHERSMPDPTLTPGVVRDTDPRVVFAPGYDRAHRVWHHKADTCRKYGIPLSDCHNFEDDDVVPICAGGDNADPRNHGLQRCDEWRDEDDVPECIAGDAADKDRQEHSECAKARRVYWAYEHGRASLEQATQALLEVQTFFISYAWRR